MKVIGIAVWLAFAGWQFISGACSLEAMLLAFLVADVLLRRAGHP
jgi:hypothetical protein